MLDCLLGCAWVARVDRAGTELGWETYRPDDATLASIAVPIELLAGRDSAPLFHQAAAWLAARLGTRVRVSCPARTCPCSPTPPSWPRPCGRCCGPCPDGYGIAQDDASRMPQGGGLPRGGARPAAR